MTKLQYWVIGLVAVSCLAEDDKRAAQALDIFDEG